jgi:hypothetical protein
MTPLEFTIDWGYQFLYSRRHYHPAYCWDGRIECRGGSIHTVHQLRYPVVWWGVVLSPEETKLEGCTWQSTTRRGMSGIRVTADCGEAAEFVLATAQGEFRFSARRIREEGRIVFPVGSKYSHCTILVTRKGHLWFRPPPLPQETAIDAAALQGVPHGNWQRMDQAWIAPGARAGFELTLPATTADGESHWLLHLQAMSMGGTPEQPQLNVKDYVPIEVRADGRSLAAFRHYLRFHDQHLQILNDLWLEIPFSALLPGPHRFELVNQHRTLSLLVNRVSIRPRVHRHLDLTAPRWALVGREFILRLQILESGAPVALDYDPAAFRLVSELSPDRPLHAGPHELRLVPLQPQRDARIGATDLRSGRRMTTTLAAIYQLPAETPEVKIGYDMTFVAHDDTGEMDWLLDYTQRTQLANLVIFRAFTPCPIAPTTLQRWGRFCREHGLYVETVNCLETDALPAAAGDHFHSGGTHELSGVVYAHNPDNGSRTMKDAAERFTDFIREPVRGVRALGVPVAFGDASCGHRYSLMAGATFLRAETMVPHTTLLLTQARPAAQALGTGEWGVHIAIQHAKQPYLESHLGWYYLSLAQPWIMGANFLYEEDSLFVMSKEERQCWDDALTKGKRDMTRDFLRFAQTHPRTRRPEVAIGALLGRYAAPFNGFICDSEQDPSYSVWGRFGRTDPTWGHRQPEKAHQVLDVLMPGASTHPLRQQHDRRRFFFSGSPHGDFDQPPIEAGREFLARYRLLLLLGWNTLIEADYRKLRQYVEAGGTLLLGVPQLSTHEGRDFLQAFDDLALYQNGNVADLCGVTITGRGPRYSGRWQAVDETFAGAACPPLSRAPSVAPDEDGPCHVAAVSLAGARPVIVDASNQQPLLVEHRLGQGRVYLITTWAYPGHEELADFSGAVVDRLCREHQGACRVADPSREVFWTHWPDAAGSGKLFLLNTDWTERGNVKTVTVETPSLRFACTVREREMSIVTLLPFGALVQETAGPHVETLRIAANAARLRVHTAHPTRFRLHAADSWHVQVDGISVPLSGGAAQGWSFDLPAGPLTQHELQITRC